MDSISVKLIDRNTLKKELFTFKKLYRKEKEKTFLLEEEIVLYKKTNASLKSLYLETNKQKEIYHNSLEVSKNLFKQNRKKHIRNSFMLFGGGVAVGVTVFVLFID